MGHIGLQGELRSAQEAMDGALAIRRSLHTRDAGKHLFSKELQQGEKTKLEIEQKRRTLRLGLQAKIRKGVQAAGGGAAESKPGLLSVLKGLKELSPEPSSEASVGGPSSLRQPLLAAEPPAATGAASSD